MRTLEHRRHGRREPAGVHLTPEGRSQARHVGRTLPRFDRVVTSPKPRAVETAEAMGFRVDAELPGLGQMPDDVGIQVDELLPRTFADYVGLVGRSETMRDYGRGQEELWRSELDRVPDGGRLLLISHGGIIEFGAATAAGSRARGWGPVLGHLEGVRLTHDGRRWVHAEVLRVPAGPA